MIGCHEPDTPSPDALSTPAEERDSETAADPGPATRTPPATTSTASTETRDNTRRARPAPHLCALPINANVTSSPRRAQDGAPIVRRSWAPFSTGLAERILRPAQPAPVRSASTTPTGCTKNSTTCRRQYEQLRYRRDNIGDLWPGQPDNRASNKPRVLQIGEAQGFLARLGFFASWLRACAAARFSAAFCAATVYVSSGLAGRGLRAALRGAFASPSRGNPSQAGREPRSRTRRSFSALSQSSRLAIESNHLRASRVGQSRRSETKLSLRMSECLGPPYRGSGSRGRGCSS